MKLGTETGNVVNYLHSCMTKGQPAPEVGMGVTTLQWSDRDAGTINKVFTIGKYQAISFTIDDATRTDKNGMSDAQKYEYTPRPDGAEYTYRFRNDRWEQVRFSQETNRWKKVNGPGLRIGIRDKFYDYSF